MTATYMFNKQRTVVNLGIAFVLALLILSLFALAFVTPVFAYNAMFIGEIWIFLQGHAIGVFAWNGLQWVASQVVKEKISDVALASAIAIAGAIYGIAKFIFTTPWDTLPTPYNAQNAYWDYNNGYWVYPSIAPNTDPLKALKKNSLKPSIMWD